MTREEEIITEFEAASNCRCTDNEKSLILAAMEWADIHPRKGLVDIDKACEWIKENIDHYIGFYLDDGDTYLDTPFFGAFREAMEG